MDIAEKTYQALIDQMERTLVEALMITITEQEMIAAFKRYKVGTARAREIREFLKAQKDDPG